ncbi:hypothetical protein T492DRAFT_879199 [Pavlovales sp. CCMP2436]|nr:hypothetical protein T492DRAFT_879199 [Pavlovales sp. CCMP2436]
MAQAHVKFAEQARGAGVATLAVARKWRPHKTCAVVGGAPSLMMAKMGAEIDEHEARVSLYGFSSPCDLGTKYRHYYPGFKYTERVQVNTVKVVLTQTR